LEKLISATPLPASVPLSAIETAVEPVYWCPPAMATVPVGAVVSSVIAARAGSDRLP
jgi:hypothetical protein